jgi:hypothetical protein
LRGAAAEAQLRRVAARCSNLLHVGRVARRGCSDKLLQMPQCNSARFGFEGIGLSICSADDDAKRHEFAEPSAHSGWRPTSGFKCQA